MPTLRLTLDFYKFKQAVEYKNFLGKKPTYYPDTVFHKINKFEDFLEFIKSIKDPEKVPFPFLLAVLDRY